MDANESEHLPARQAPPKAGVALSNTKDLYRLLSLAQHGMPDVFRANPVY